MQQMYCGNICAFAGIFIISVKSVMNTRTKKERGFCLSLLFSFRSGLEPIWMQVSDRLLLQPVQKLVATYIFFPRWEERKCKSSLVTGKKRACSVMRGFCRAPQQDTGTSKIIVNDTFIMAFLLCFQQSFSCPNKQSGSLTPHSVLFLITLAADHHTILSPAGTGK